MSFNDVLGELPALYVSKRRLLIRRAMDSNETPLSSVPEAVSDQRRAAHQQDPATAIPLEMKARFRHRSGE